MNGSPSLRVSGVDRRWPSSLLQSLRSGRQRIASGSIRWTGRTFPQLRRQLNGLPADQLWALQQALACGIGLASTRMGERQVPELRPAFLDALARGLQPHAEAVLLLSATRDRFGRRHWLQPAACRAWLRMHDSARRDGVELELISSFRSFADQCRILRRKIRQGQDWPLILKVSAAPGFSEHHTGCAVDIAEPGQSPLTQEFEHSAAFAWLSTHAVEHGFKMSYPPDNRWGFVYEPWHWRYWPGASPV